MGDRNGWSPEFSAWYDGRREHYLKEARDYLNEAATNDEIDDEIENELEAGMTERGMIFNAEMVRALLSGRKTQTRRPVKFPVRDKNFGCELAGNELAGELSAGNYLNSAYGKPGDHIWVRETFSCIGNEDGHPVDAKGNLCTREEAQRIYRASAIQKPNNYGLWSSPDGFDFEGAGRHQFICRAGPVAFCWRS